MIDIRQKLDEYFTEDQVDVIVPVLQAGAAYAKGDAMAGLQLSNIDRESYDRLTEVFQEAGFDVTFTNRMSVVGFTTDPKTHDEELNEAIIDI